MAGGGNGGGALLIFFGELKIISIISYHIVSYR